MKRSALLLWTMTAAFALAAFPFCGVSAAATRPPVQYIISPESPEPNSPVYIEVQGVGSFLGDAKITWGKDGKIVSSGTGLKTFSFTSGALGEKTTITLSIESGTYGLITKTFTFNPSYVNLIWEARTTTPLLYAGKALPTSGSTITVFAFPLIMSGNTIRKASELSFQWRLNDEPMVADSGEGRDTFTFKNNQLKNREEVSVDVVSQGDTVAHANLVIPISTPSLLLYVHDPLRGVKYRSALQNTFSLEGTEATLRAEPYFFSTESGRSGALQYTWQINGEDTTGPNASKGELTLRKTGEGEGSASLSIGLQNNETDKLLQGAQAVFTILFTKANTAGSSLFGL